MLAIAGLLLIGVGLMHSILGQKHIVQPLSELDNLPRLFGSQRAMRLTLSAGWHIITLFWASTAMVLFWMAYTPENLNTVFLLSVAVPCALMGMFALIFSKGKHLSYVFFLPIAALTMLAAFSS